MVASPSTPDAQRRVGTSKPVLRVRSMRATRGALVLGPFHFACSIGRSGLTAVKREGDGATPLRPLRPIAAFYRADRILRPVCRLPLRALRPDDGWCDDVGDRNYNRAVRHPYPASAERMWREDRLYDIVVVLDHNVVPRARGLGSAIFLHVAPEGGRPTAGCIAVSLPALRRLLRHLDARRPILIHR